MKVVIFHGSPHKGNTHYVTNIFVDELAKCGDTSVTEFFLPQSLPEFCTGCTLCLGGLREQCPNAQYVTPIMDAIINADALVFATPHYGACSMPGSMKNLLDHIRLLTNKWNKMPLKKQVRYEKSLRQSARKFYDTKIGHPHLYSIIWYHLFKFVLKNYVGKDDYAYKLWEEKGYFKKRPF
jgi:multimeric flavodoxin WrbA